MAIFLELFYNLIPLYALIALGWVAGRFYDVDAKSLGSLAIYMLVPVVMFGFIVSTEFKPEFIALPFIVYFLFSTVSIAFYMLGKQIYPDNRANILGMCAGSGNTGYFGVPVAIMLMPSEWVGIYVFSMLGGILLEGTVTFYITNRGQFTVADSIKKLVRYPAIYAIAAGFIASSVGLQMEGLIGMYWEYFKGAYIVVGMMIIGAALSKSKNLEFSGRFVGLVFLGKFIVFPALTLLFFTLDYAFFGLLQKETRLILFLMAIVPTAANVTAFAAQLNLRPEKVATTVLLGTLFALFYIPFVLILTGMAG